MEAAKRLGLIAIGFQLALWSVVALLAWPGRFPVLNAPWVVAFVSFGLAGALLVFRRPHHPIGWLMLAFGVLASIGLVGVLLASRLIAGGAPVAGAWADAVGNASMTAAILAVPATLILFPDGVAPGRAGRFLLWIMALAAAIGFGASMLNGGWGGDPGQALVESPLRQRTAPLGDVVAQVFQIGMALSVIGAAASLLQRWRRSTGLERQQIKWLTASAGLFVVALASTGFNTAEQWEIVVAAAALSTIPVAIVIAVLRYRLYDIDRLISRTVSYTVMVGLLGLMVLALVAGMAVFLPSDDPLVVAVATLTVAGLFNPLRVRVQRVVDHRFNRSRYDAERVVDRFTGSLQEQVDPDEVVADWLGVVVETVQPASAGVWLRESAP
jgi:hypothetical protein